MIEYQAENCVTFRRVSEPFGGLGNMAGGYPIRLGPHQIRTSEHLYQMLRFPDHPDIQSDILRSASPMMAKQRAYQSLDLSRPDWHLIKPDVMLWCLELKLVNNTATFGRLLQDTGGREIVEVSRKDDYWGAKPDASRSVLCGWNVLGRLLRMLRRRLEIAAPINLRTAVIDIPNFRLFGEDAIVLAFDPAFG